MITDYKDMRLRHLLELQTLSQTKANDAVKEIMAISILADVSVEDLRALPASKYAKLREGLAFLQKEPPKDAPVVQEITLNGTVYTVCRRMDQITTAQYIDWCTYISGDRNIVDLYSCFIIPKGHKYADGYDLEKAKEDILELPLPVVNFISVFWKTSLTLFLRRSAREIRKQTRKLRRLPGLTAEQREMAREMDRQTKSLQSALDTGGIVSQR